jgi:serine/threonine-protein kinase RsbW
METAVFPGRYQSLASISEFIFRAAQRAGLDSKATYAVQMAVDEACTNIIEHAYGGEGKGTITCSVGIDPTSLTIQLEDQGKPFNPKKIKNPNTHLPLSRRKEGGLGLFFIRQYMDEVRFEFSAGQGNRLIMVKYR